MTSQFLNMTSSSNFFDDALFILSYLGTGLSFVSISSLVLELWQFSFIRDWPEIRISKMPLSEFFPISGDWGELGIPNLARIFLMKCYWMLQNARVTVFKVSQLFWVAAELASQFFQKTSIELACKILFVFINWVHCKASFLQL